MWVYPLYERSPVISSDKVVILATNEIEIILSNNDEVRLFISKYNHYTEIRRKS
jgi:hypothetical protein